MGRFDDERRELVASLKTKGIKDERVLAAMLKVERHIFVLDAFLNKAYEDTALPIGSSQTISQPYTVAFMTEALNPPEGGRVLEIGTGSGYQAAILAEMGCKVYTIERHMELHLQSRRLLERLGYRIASKCGDGTVGWSDAAPFDGIVVTAAAPKIPDALVQQLAEGGRLVIPIGDLELQKIQVVTKAESGLSITEAHGFKFVPLIGKKGWNGKS